MTKADNCCTCRLAINEVSLVLSAEISKWLQVGIHTQNKNRLKRELSEADLRQLFLFEPLSGSRHQRRDAGLIAV